MVELKSCLFKSKDARKNTIEFIWGLKSWDDISNSQEATIDTMNDIDIVYDHKSQKYILGIETIYWFESKKDEIEYLRRLLDAFTEFMLNNNYNMDITCNLYSISSEAIFIAEDLTTLYTQFKIFVEGFIVVNSI